MKMLELFAGTGVMSKAFARAGFETYTIDWNPDFNLSLCADIGALSAHDITTLCDGVPNVIWASPDCTTYSIAGISHHRVNLGSDLAPVSEYARFCDKTNTHVIELIKEIQPKYWFIENPRGGLRKMSFMRGLPRYTVTYCQYGAPYMKPTDIWTNHPDPRFKAPCRNGDPCHDPAPRHSKTGLQGVKGKKARSMIPIELCDHIAYICKEGLNGNDIS